MTDPSIESPTPRQILELKLAQMDAGGCLPSSVSPDDPPEIVAVDLIAALEARVIELKQRVADLESLLVIRGGPIPGEEKRARSLPAGLDTTPPVLRVHSPSTVQRYQMTHAACDRPIHIGPENDPEHVFGEDYDLQPCVICAAPLTTIRVEPIPAPPGPWSRGTKDDQ